LLELQKLINDPDCEWETSFLAGLMHDVGILVLDNIIPEEYYKLLTLKDLSSTDQSLEELEMGHFKVDHSEVGAMFMEKWLAISDKVNSATLTHHKPGPAQIKTVNLYQLVSTANRIVNHHGITHPVMTAFEDPPEEGYLDSLGFSQEDLDIVINTNKIGLLAAETIFRSN
jgi:HD-like signal output (HDOD) protein